MIHQGNCEMTRYAHWVITLLTFKPWNKSSEFRTNATMAHNNRVRCRTDSYVERRYHCQVRCYVYGFLRWAI